MHAENKWLVCHMPAAVFIALFMTPRSAYQLNWSR